MKHDAMPGPWPTIRDSCSYCHGLIEIHPITLVAWGANEHSTQ